MTAVMILIVLVGLLWLIGQSALLVLLWGQQERTRTRLESLVRFTGVLPAQEPSNAPAMAPEHTDSTVIDGMITAAANAAPATGMIRPQPSAPQPELPGDLTFPPPVRRRPPVPAANVPLPPVEASIAPRVEARHANQATPVAPLLREPADQPDGGLPLDSMLPDFELRTIDGERFRRSQLPDRRIALVFLAPESPGSSAVLETIRSAQVRKRSLPDLILVINGGTARDSLRRWLGRLPKRVTVLVQDDIELAAMLRVPGTPAAYLLNHGAQTSGPLRTGARAVLESLGVGVSQMTAAARRSTELTTNRQTNQRSFSGLPVGTPVPEMPLQLLGGGEWARTPGRASLLILWDAACPPCDQMREELIRELPAWHGFDSVVVTRGAGTDTRWLEELRQIVPIVLQSGFDVAQRLQVLEAPAAVAITPDGTIDRPPAVGAAAVLALGRSLHERAARSGAMSAESENA